MMSSREPEYSYTKKLDLGEPLDDTETSRNKHGQVKDWSKLIRLCSCALSAKLWINIYRR